MKKIIYSVFALVAIFCFASCNKEELNGAEKALNETEDVTISIKSDLFTSEDGTKVSINGKQLLWSAKDSIGVIKESIVKRNLEPMAYNGDGTFSGKISRGEEGENFLIIYPYFSNEYKRDDGRVTEIPFGVYQTAVKDGLPLIANSIDPSMNGKPAVVLAGKTTNASGHYEATLSCRNALLKFKIGGTDIKEVCFTMSSGTMAADRAYYCYGAYSSKVEGSLVPEDGWCETQTIVVRPQGETFEPGTYYASILPNNYTIAVTVFNTNGQYISRTSSAQIDVKGGVIYTLGKKNSEDTTTNFTAVDKLKSFSGSNLPEKTANYDFSRGGVKSRDSDKNYTVPIPSDPEQALSSNSNYKDTEEPTEDQYDMGLKNDKKYYLETVESTTYLRFNKGKNPYISCPAVSAYTIKSAEIEFAEAYENVNVYFGKGAAPSQWNMTADHQKVHIGTDKKAVVYTAHCTPYCRYYLLFNTTDSNGKEVELDTDILIKKVTFTYAFGSWHGSWE